MRTIKQNIMLCTLLLMAVACTTEDPFLDYNNNGTNWNDGGSMPNGGTSTTEGNLATFDIATEQDAEEPTTTAQAYYPDAEDQLANNSFGTTVTIDMSNPVAKTENGVEVTVSGGHVTVNHGTQKGICYVVSGTTTNGSLTVLGEKKYQVVLNGVNIYNPDSAALNLLSSKRAFVSLTEGTTNQLTDGADGSHKGTLYAKGKLLFNGSGTLVVDGHTNNGIHSADYIVFNHGNHITVTTTVNHGIKANDGIFINGGVLNVEVSGAGAKGINSESHIVINGGRTTVITTGKGSYDSDTNEVKGAAGIKADSTLTINDGDVLLKSTGYGGKGISVDMDANFNGGNIYVVTTGGKYTSSSDSTSPKGIKAEGNINISGGRIWVRTSGNGGEGIESKQEISITGGDVASYAYDDAINAKSTMTIAGGTVYAHGQHNDGLDANGNLYIKGGVVYAICSGSPEVAVDANTEGGYKLYVTGGTLVAVGGLERGSQLSQTCYQASSWTPNAWYAMTVDGQTFSFLTPASGGQGMVVSGSVQPTLKQGVTVTDGNTCMGGIGVTAAGISGGSSVSLSSYTSSSSGFGGGGWR